ncbi:3-alpha domain protein [compost metagenome]
MRLWHYLYVDTMNQDALQEIANLDLLPASWRDYASKRLATHTIEDWTRRLEGQQES